MADLLIRAFQPGDAPALWAVFFESVRQVAARDYSPEQVAAWAPEQPDLAQWTQRLQRLAPFVAERAAALVGYADVQADGYIDHFYVAASAGRQGVGSALMQQIHDTAAQRQTPLLYAQVSLTARPFFEKWGFVVLTRQTVWARGVAMDNLRMHKPLTK